MATAPHSMFARIYDLLMVPNDRLGLRRQRARLCQHASGRVLEIAVGTGLNLSYYERADLVVGIDNNTGMLRRAIRRTWESPAPVDLVAADARSLPFGDNEFDAAVIALSLCTVPEPERVLAEIARVTRSAGTLHFLEHVRSPRDRMARLQDRIKPAWETISGGCRSNQDTEGILRNSPWTIRDLWRSDTGGMIQGTATLETAGLDDPL
ncbi:MAG: methyltransferase domain-containing protein [Acidimicrobiia bacterium]|nr:methyltransferase domain-containing protein [Acidimicrobiia bacterium]